MLPDVLTSVCSLHIFTPCMSTEATYIYFLACSDPTFVKLRSNCTIGSTNTFSRHQDQTSPHIAQIHAERHYIKHEGLFLHSHQEQTSLHITHIYVGRH
jgi:hypothetical protein